MNAPYAEPSKDKSAFNCPFCGAYASMAWSGVFVQTGGGFVATPHAAVMCTHCTKWSLWVKVVRLGKTGRVEEWEMVHPVWIPAATASADLPSDCTADFEEARRVSSISPRASAALLRLCIQRLCRHLGGDGKNLNEDIGRLVKRGLDERVKKVLDIVRVTGNNAVHPGQMDLDDKPEIVLQLFALVNMIVDQMITRPRQIDEIFTGLPDDAREQIVKRDETARGRDAGAEEKGS